MPHKIGIYVRVSTEEQAQVLEGSIESQQHRLKCYVDVRNLQEDTWGKVVDSYIDDGYSAKDTRRPAYQRMMRDIRAAKINLILVTDISRLSRNISDFCVLLKDLEDHKAKFFSVKEQFDTSTPAGEMMIFNMINLAQFERKQTSERVSLNFHSRAMRGLLNGGGPVLGYDKDPNNPGKLVVNEGETPLVRRLFETYLETGSLQETASIMSATGARPKLSMKRKCRHVNEGRWTIVTVRTHLKNFAYIGKREVNRKYKNEDQKTLKAWQRYQIVDASWPGIIDEDTFYTAQKLIESNRLRERDRFKNGSRRCFLLSGILRCGNCGMALIGQAAHGTGNIHRYYGHKIVVGEKNKCKIKRFRADEIEKAVVEHLDEILLRAGHLDTVEENIKRILGVEGMNLSKERDQIDRDLSSLEKDIDAAFKLLESVGPGSNAASLVQEKLEKLSERKKKLNSHRERLLAELDRHRDAKAARLAIENAANSFRKGWPKASPAVQKRLIRGLLDELVYSPEGLQTYYVLAPDKMNAAQGAEKKVATETNSVATIENMSVLTLKDRRTGRFFSSQNSPVVQTGGGAGN